MAPPLGRQDSIFSIEWYAKLRHGPPFCNLGTRFQHTNGGRRPFFWSSPNFGPKSGLNLSEDLFFGLHRIMGRKRTDFGWKNFYKFSDFPGPPSPFENPAYATVQGRSKGSLVALLPNVFVPAFSRYLSCRGNASLHLELAPHPTKFSVPSQN